MANRAKAYLTRLLRMVGCCEKSTTRPMLKRLLVITAIALPALVLVALIAAVFLVDPNRYKDEISAYASRQAGREVHIIDDMKLAVFPWLGVTFGRVTLANAPGFGSEPLAEIKKARISVRLLPLLSRQLQFDTLYVDGLEVRLEKDGAGRKNWQGLGKGQAEAEPPMPVPAGEPALALPAALSIGGLDVRHATVHWRDASSGSAIDLTDVELASGRIAADTPVDFKLDFNLHRADSPRDITAKAAAKVEASAQHARLYDIDARIDDTRLGGNFAIADFSRPAFDFDLTLDTFDADRYLPRASKNAAALPVAPAAAAKLPVETLRDLRLDGRLKVDELKISGLALRDVHAGIKAKDGVLTFAPLSAVLYGGRYEGEVRVDGRATPPAINADTVLSGVKVEPLLKDLFEVDAFSGIANFKAQLTAHGASEAEMRQSLNGTAQVGLRNGVIKGFNVAELIREAKAKLEGQSGPPAAKPDTDFAELSASLAITDGIARNDDLRGSSPYLRLGGDGEADLVRERIDYRLRARIVDTPTGQSGAGLDELKGVDIPVRISGALAKPDIGIDSDAVRNLLRDRLEKEVQKKARKELERKFKDAIKGLSQ